VAAFLALATVVTTMVYWGVKSCARINHNIKDMLSIGSHIEARYGEDEYVPEFSTSEYRILGDPQITMSRVRPKFSNGLIGSGRRGEDAHIRNHRRFPRHAKGKRDDQI
jgi:hypothetical protein